MAEHGRDASEAGGAPQQAGTALLECRNITKGFGGVPVLKGVSLHLEPGTITALAGENGAGKSTLMKIASGQYRPDGGEVFVGGQLLPAGNPQAAHKLGVAIVPQELASILELSVYENLFVGRELRGPFGLRRKAMIEEARKQLEVFGLDLDPRKRMGDLAVGVRQIIEIVKATNTGAGVILLDEPSSAISEREVGRLMAVMRKLREDGVALLFTTHKMEEMRALADRVVVLRDGNLVVDLPLSELSDDDIVTAMIGRELEDLFPDRGGHSDEVLLELDELQVPGASEPMSLTVRRGEIVGLSGLVGAGRTELMETIFGVRTSQGGSVKVRGKKVKPGEPAAAIGANIALVPEDRKGSGAVLTMSVLDNATLPDLPMFSTAGMLRGGFRRSKIREVMDSVRLRSRGLDQSMGTLSGGNQQKVVLARWLTSDVDVLLLDEPTRGVDVGARSEIYRIITDLAAEGMAVLMASSDMPEILSLSHRALVLREGAVVGELSADDLADSGVQDRIFRLASGLDSEGNETNAAEPARKDA
ncbi:sugar ABC transporter ATP-binding protein [Leucobacter sp. CSA1]|uniref:Sugar ABC transporter ATP-binding protein n=1 Tax=Leucobacter chromiisoli TaxID=2796471 RepID=A0A934UUB2_9MICO|nr:sugar ABC transporter ATP-binding protein [Leucobacter chromiisoli]MBK0418640.1 sugar ABC transporter ATP-binding protein [Leucobacter chromiisoli]